MAEESENEQTNGIGNVLKHVESKKKDHRTIKDKVYMKELHKLEVELVKLQEWVVYKKLKIVVVFEGRDAAGKGGVIKRIATPVNPRVCKIAALGTPTDKEKTEW